MDIFERAVSTADHASTQKRPEAPARVQPAARRREGFGAERGPEYRLDLHALEKAGNLVPQGTGTRQVEDYRLLKRPVLLNAFGKGSDLIENGNLVVVTSALPGDGKTFTSLNLAMSIAQEQDRTVLLIDADLTQRSLTHQLGLSGARGLTDLLMDPPAGVGEVLGRTNVPKLRVIAAGTPSPDTTELLASDQMESLMADLASHYDDRIVLFDCPPLLAASQAQVLTQLAGQVLMVVREGKTPRSAIDEALDLLDEDQVVGMVLNDCGRSRGASYYGGYYGAYPERGA
jgi:protein-tyrosine kinase